ncbi:MAG: methylase, partial [Clostridia bacterium]|nr:methylase [Clostridia bacterium]
MTDTQRREAARKFYYKWKEPDKGQEKIDCHPFWIEIFQNILGVEDVTERIEFEKPIGSGTGSTNWIDVYVKETKTLIEQKSRGIALDKPQPSHDGKTPYEQAKDYDNSLSYGEKARWIVLSNFDEIWIYDMEKVNPNKPEPAAKLGLMDLQAKYAMLDFLVEKETVSITDEMKVSLAAGDLVGKIYDALLKQYKNPDDPGTLISLNKLCVRLVFCLYAEDAGVFAKDQFVEYLQSFRPE